MVKLPYKHNFPNPLQEIRILAELSTEDLGLRAKPQVRPSMVNRYESGATSSLPVWYLSILSALSGRPPESLSNEFSEWQSSTRASYYKSWEPVIYAIQYEPGLPLQAIIEISGPTLHHFCRKLCVDPKQVEQALSGSKSPDLVAKLKEVGIEWVN